MNTPLISSRWVALMAAFLTILGMGAGWTQVVDSVVKSVKGKVEFAAPDSANFQPLVAGQKLVAGSQVRTAPGAEAIINVTPGSAIRVDEKTTIKIDGMEFAKTDGKVTKRKATIDLADGTISALIDHNNPEATDFKIKTPQGSAAARGTFYGVSVNKGQTFVKVAEGKVGFQKVKTDKDKDKDPKAKPAVKKT